jgi:hypothetical protein
LPRNPGEELDVALRQILDMHPSGCVTCVYRKPKS